MELYCKWSCCFCSIRYLFLIGIHVLISNAILYSEDDLYTTNFTTTYSNIPSDCSLFGRKFEKDYPDNDLILNTTETGTYWVGAKIGFKRNLNPLGVLNVCKGTHRESLNDCNIHCKDWKYFSYKEHICNCSNNNHTEDKLSKTNVCNKPENGLCYGEGCVVYERGVLNKDYLCGVYYYYGDAGWIYSTQNCFEKFRFICEGEKLQSDATESSWLEAEHICAEKALHLSQNKIKIQGDARFKDGTRYWVSVFRRKEISWGEDSLKTVCVAARIQPNGSYQLETHFCNESLEALCHRTGHTDYGSSDAEIMTASLGSVLGGVLVCIVVVASIKHRRGHLRNIPTPPQEVINISPTSTGMKMIKGIDEPLYSNSDDPVGDLSIYSFAKDHTEPGENIDTQDKQYDSVTYKEPRNTDEDKHYDHIMEDHYQNPYS